MLKGFGVIIVFPIYSLLKGMQGGGRGRKTTATAACSDKDDDEDEDEDEEKSNPHLRLTTPRCY